MSVLSSSQGDRGPGEAVLGKRHRLSEWQQNLRSQAALHLPPSPPPADGCERPGRISGLLYTDGSSYFLLCSKFCPTLTGWLVAADLPPQPLLLMFQNTKNPEHVAWKRP